MIGMVPDEPPCQVRDALGVMTGTSIDGMDLALVRIDGRGLAMQAELIAHVARPLGELAQPLRQLAAGEPITAGAIAQTAWAFGELHAEAVSAMLTEQGRTEPPDIIAVHGQTVFHQPPISWQLINPAPIAARFDCRVVFDLRQADLAAGGQGAPITPLADGILFRHETKRRAIVNLGGFCNITILPSAPPRDDDSMNLDEIRGFDLCACNQLLDRIARQMLNAPYDDRGRAAGSGQVKHEVASVLLQMLRAQRTTQRSLGTGDECAAWVQDHCKTLSATDLAASAVWAVGNCISTCIEASEVDEVILAGGGARNETLVQSISDASAVPVTMSDAHGIACEAREAVAIAVLGMLCADRAPITLPPVTGCRTPAPIAGKWILP